MESTRTYDNSHGNGAAVGRADPGVYDDEEQRNRADRNQFGYLNYNYNIDGESLNAKILNSMIVTITIATLLLLGFVVWHILIQPPPVELVPSMIEIPGAVCPGDEIVSGMNLIIHKPSVLETDVVIVSRSSGEIITGTEKSEPDTPRPYKEIIRMDVHWVIPDLEPDNYSRIIAIAAENQTAKASFVDIRFTVGEDCPFEN